MVRIKGNCEECGKRVAASKLIILAKTSKKMCLNCRKKELKRRNKPIIPTINNSCVNPSIKSIKTTGSHFTGNSGLSKDEEIVLKLKYGYDPFKSGKLMCKQIKNLKQKLIIQKINNKKQHKQESDKIIKKTVKNAEMNRKFINGLK